MEGGGRDVECYPSNSAGIWSIASSGFRNMVTKETVLIVEGGHHSIAGGPHMIKRLRR